MPTRMQMSYRFVLFIHIIHSFAPEERDRENKIHILISIRLSMRTLNFGLLRPCEEKKKKHDAMQILRYSGSVFRSIYTKYKFPLKAVPNFTSGLHLSFVWLCFSSLSCIIIVVVEFFIYIYRVLNLLLVCVCLYIVFVFVDPSFSFQFTFAYLKINYYSSPTANEWIPCQ